MRAALRPTTVACVAALALAGCGPVDASDEAVTQTADAIDLSLQSSALLLTVIRAVDGATTGVEVVRRARAQLLAEYTGCVARAEADEAARTVTQTLTNCAGRYGLRDVSGTLTWTFTPLPAGVAVRVQADGLRVGAVTYETLRVAATVRLAASLYGLQVSEHTVVARGPRGHLLRASLEAPQQSVWHPPSLCYTYAVAWRLDVGARDAGGADPGRYRFAVQGYRRCAGQCPQPADDVVTWTDTALARSLSVSFRAGGSAQWVARAGGSVTGRGNFRLACLTEP